MPPRPRRRAIHPLRRAVPAQDPAPVLARGRPAPRLPIATPCGIEDYFHQINIASTTDAQHHRIGERYGVRVGPRVSRRTRAWPTGLVAAQIDPNRDHLRRDPA